MSIQEREKNIFISKGNLGNEVKAILSELVELDYTKEEIVKYMRIKIEELEELIQKSD